MKNLALSMFFVLALVSTGSAQNRNLKGLTGVSIRVQVFDQDKILSAARIKSDVEVELRKADVKVFDIDSITGGPPSVARLFVLVNTIRVTGGTYACYVSLQLQERVTLERKPSERLVVGIWEQAEMTTAERADDMRLARDRVADIAKTFANDFLAANPK